MALLDWHEVASQEKQLKHKDTMYMRFGYCWHVVHNGFFSFKIPYSICKNGMKTPSSPFFFKLIKLPWELQNKHMTMSFQCSHNITVQIQPIIYHLLLQPALSLYSIMYFYSTYLLECPYLQI